MYVKERFKLDESIVDELYSRTPKFGYNGFGEFVFYRTYSRTKEDGSQESWADVVKRVTEGTFSIRKDWYVKNHIKWDNDFWMHYALHFSTALFEMKFLPPGRGLWAMGSDFVYQRGSMALNNCAYLNITDDIGHCVDWIMDCLMCGVGVGFNPIRNDDLITYNPTGTFEFIIPDSREGWCQATKILINSYLRPGLKNVKLIYEKIRPAGLPIKGFGGISSGPGPLILFHNQIRDFFHMYEKYDWYNSVMLKADIANAAGCAVVSGNVRRSAELCCGPYDDIMDLKNYEKYPYRESIGWMSNNSVILEKDEDFQRLNEISGRVIVNGEPGLINMKNLKYGRIGKPMNDLRYDKADGFNPCLMSTTKLLTPQGIRNLKDCNIGDEIWSETGWTKIIKKWSTGVNPVFAFHTTAGIFYGTENHRIVYDGYKVEIKYAPGIDILRGIYNPDVGIDSQDVVDGLVIGDGTNTCGQIALCIGSEDQDYFNSEIKTYIGQLLSADVCFAIRTTISHLPRTFERSVPERFMYGDRHSICGFLRGLFSANGCVSKNTVMLKATSFKIIEQVQLMLSSIGIKSYYMTTKAKIDKWHNGSYWSKESYNLVISDDRSKFLECIGFIQGYKQELLEQIVKKINTSASKRTRKNTFDIIEIEPLGEEETFDITVDNQTHTYWTQGLNVSNCGEMQLEGGGELCCLAETLPTLCNSKEEWLKSCEYATFYASTVTLLPTHRPETNAIMLRNRRIGVSIIDVSKWEYEIGTTRLISALREGYNRVRSTNNWLNDEAGIPRAIRVTTIKPSGTVPKMPGVRSSWSWPTFGKTLRRVRVAQNSPIFSILHNANVPHEPDRFSANTEVFEFPIDQSDGGKIKPATDISLWRQAMMLTLLQREWSDNAVSNTLYFHPKWPLIKSINLGESFYPEDLSLEVVNQIYEYLPFSWHEFLDVQEWEDGDTRLIMEQDRWSENWLLKVYKYNKDHEEDDIEPVLAAIAPLTKSVSLLPHSANGVYVQSPEEGISDEEYARRLAAIKPIDWSTFSGSDGVDEKYCSGASCEVTIQ